ncbi:MAG: DnaJ domain-containing protein [Phycisphaeraceae bacterium]|nr:DnaJ domain-containing protein [Phycisphaeraceae bacterium]
MQGWPWKKQAQPGDASWRQRKAHRYGGETVRCALGEVADISASGMRVLCDGKPPVKQGGAIPVRLKFSDGSLQVGTQVRWVKRRGLKRHEIGLQFVQLKPGVEKVLEAIARFGMAEAAKHLDEDRGRDQSEPRKKRKVEKPRAEVELPNYYKTLELDPEATAAEIKASYRRLATMYHPDRNDSAEALKRFEDINEAYHVLRDAQRRSSYGRMAG